MPNEKCDPCGDRKDPSDVRRVYPYEKKNSPYWSWALKHARTDEYGNVIEPYAANPSQFAEPPEHIQSDELQAIREVLDEGGLDRLTTRQRRAFKLVLIEGLSYRKAGRRMAISAQTVREHVLAAGKRFKKMCEDKI